MHEAEKLSLDQIQAFLQASQTIRFEGESRPQVYYWIEQVLCLQQYHQQSRGARGLIRLYLAKMTGLSRAQVTRLIARYRTRGTVQPAVYRRHRFPQRYTRADLELLATVDEAHENLSVRPRAAFSNENTGSTASRNTSAWRRSRWPTSTTCGSTRAITNAVCTTPRPGPSR